jgi:hypothetical protein
MTIDGVDIASHQGPNFAYPPDIAFAIVKASGGHSYGNPYLGAQVAGARAAGLEVAFYHYMFEPTSGGGDPLREAANFVAACRPYVREGSSFWLDVEEFPAKVGYTGDLGDWIIAFQSEIERAFGCVPGIYCATWYLRPTGLWQDGRLARYPFWMASWQDTVPPAPFMAPWTKLTVWQYTAVPINRDRFFGTREEFRALGIPAPTPPPASDDPITAETAIGPDGVPVTTIRWGGQATMVLGTAYVDVGVRIVNAAGDVYHRSILGGVAQPYVKE